MRDQPLALYKNKQTNKQTTRASLYVAPSQDNMGYYHPLMLLILLFAMSLQATMPFAADESPYALLKLKQSLTNASALASWDPLTIPCTAARSNWVGVICSANGNVFGLKLETMGLLGNNIDLDALSSLQKLRSISFKNNQLGGSLPNIKNLKALKSIYLSNNLFQGVIDPQAFRGLKRLRVIVMANNNFTGPIPISLTKVPKLTELRLEGNQFQGIIPDFPLISFRDLNMANNQLEGPIPINFSRLSPDIFTGNEGLCGVPLAPCKIHTQRPEERLPPLDPPSKLVTQPSNDNSKYSIIPLVIAISAILLVILLLFGMIWKRRSRSKSQIQGQPMVLPLKKVATTKGDTTGVEGVTSAKADAGKLCFVREDEEKFDFPDLLRATAEILGSGCFGSSYKASMLNGTMMVVKRFKEMNNVGKGEFHEHMRRIGRIEHRNVVPLVAYYYRKEEKLLISKFVHHGSLAMHLHGNNSRGQPMLDWPTRLQIIKGVSRGLLYLYKELDLLIAPHGHLKSSNVLLDESFNPLIHDYGLIPLINQESSQQLMVAYKSPEFINKSRINKKTDVFSLGILIIEVMTGHFPTSYLQQGGKVDLSGWVKEVAGGSKGQQVFDKNMTFTINSEGEMQKTLNIGLMCCGDDVEKRWDIKEACQKIEEVKERDNDDDFYSLYTSEGDRRSSRGMSDDFTVTIA